MMKLSVLFVLVLSALSSARLQHIIENRPQHKNASRVASTPEDRTVNTPTIKTALTPRFRLSSALLRQRRQALPSIFVFEDSPNLKWLNWTGSLPNGAVAIYNTYESRTDYICKYKCESGYYNPNLGSYCYFPYDGKEYKTMRFQILVNKDNFEILEWKPGSYGSVPQHSVRTCYSEKKYVGKNKYGLGKVHVEHESFYLPWEGDEYYYKRYYEVLTYSDEVYSEHVSSVKYNTNGAEILQYPPETMRISTITNYECNPVRKTATLSKTSRVDKRWDIASSLAFGVKKTFTGGVPGVASGSIEISGEVSFQFSGGHTVSEESTHSISVELTIPPNHSCKARMVGHKYKANIPFTAHLSRRYKNGETAQTAITGTYDCVHIGEVQAVVERCVRAPDARPCPQVL